MTRFGVVWSDLSLRLEIIPGKHVLSQFRARIQEIYGISLSDSRIIDAMRREDIANDLVELLQKLETFRRSSRELFAEVGDGMKG
jgi:hypothetical protein